MELILLRSSSRNFPADVEPELVKAGYAVTSLGSLHAYIGCPVRSRPQLLVLEVGNVADLDRALMVVEWNEHVQPLAPARYVLLMASKNLTVDDHAAKLGSAEVFSLPQPMRNLLFKLELQSRLLKAAPPVTEPPRVGFAAKVEEAGPGHRRVLVVRGPPPKVGSWQDNGNTPSGKVRWRWVKNAGALPAAHDDLTWTIDSAAPPRFDAQAGAWLTSAEDDTVACVHAGETIFSSSPTGPAPSDDEAEDSEGRSEPFVAEPRPLAPSPQSPATESRLSVDRVADPALKFAADPKAAPGGGPSRIAGSGSDEEPEPAAVAKHAGKEENVEQKVLARESGAKPEPVPVPAAKPGTAAERARAAIEHAQAALQTKKERAPGAEANATGEAVSGQPQSDHTGLPEPERKISLTTTAGSLPVKEISAREPAARADSAVPHGASPMPADQTRVAERAPREAAPAEQTVRRAEREAPAPAPAREQENRAREIVPPAEKKAAPERMAAPEAVAAESPKSAAGGLPEPAKIPWGGRDSSPPASPERHRIGEETAASEPGKAAQPVDTLAAGQVAREDSFVAEPGGARAETVQSVGGGKQEEAPPLDPAETRSERPRASTSLRPALANSDHQAEPAILVTGSVPPPEDARRFLKTRHFELMTLEQLGDRESSWQPMGGFRVYLSAQHRYYGIKDPKEALPIWIYDGELAPEFIDEQRCWKFYDHLPIRIDSLSGLPAGAFEALYKLCGLEPPEEEAPHQRSRGVVLIDPSKPESKNGAKIYLKGTEADKIGGWKKIVRAVKSVFKK